MGGRGDKPESELFIEYAIRVTKSRIRLVGLGSTMLILISYTVGFLLAMILADHIASGGLGSPARAVMRWLLTFSAAAIVIVAVLIPLGRRINDLYAARLIERAHPEFRNDLTAALELAASGRIGPGPLAAIKRRAAGEVARADIDGSVTTRRLRNSAIMLGVVVLAFVIYAAISPKAIMPSMKRALGDDSVPAPTRTLIVSVEPESGTMVVAARAVEFYAEIKNPVGDAKLRISRDGGATFLLEDEFTMQEVAGEGLDGHFAATWPAAMSNGTAAFEIRCGDAVSGPHQLIVLPVPTIRRIELEYDWPEYTGRANTRQSGGRIEAVNSTRIIISAEANLPVARASVVFEKSPPIGMQVDGRSMTASIVVTSNERYKITYRGSHENIHGESIWYEITATPDAAPAVHLTEPLRRIELSVDRSLRLAGEAADDFGLSEVVLVCESADKKKILPIHQFGEPGRQACTVEELLPVSKLGRPGDLLTCHLRAKDCLPPDGQIGRSDKFELLITEPSEPTVAAGGDNDVAGDEQDPQDSALPEFVPDDETHGQEDENDSVDPDDPNQPDAPEQNDDQVRQEDLDELVNMIEQDEKLLETIRKHIESDESEKGPVDNTTKGGNSGNSDDSENSGKSGGNDEGDKQGGQGGKQGGEGDKQGGEGGKQGGEGDKQGGEGGKQGGEGDKQGGEGDKKGGEGGKQGGEGGKQGGEGGKQGGEGDKQGGEGGKGAGGKSGATGSHKGNSGGDPNSGSSDKPGEVDDPGKKDKLTPEQVKKIRSTGRTIDEADRKLRDDEVDDEMLKDLGMTREQYRNFVERYRQKLDKAKPAVDKTKRPGKVVSGSKKVPGKDGLQKGRSDDGEVSITGSEELTEEEKRRLNESQRSKVSPEYRKHVDEFYRSISDDEENKESEDKPAAEPKENAK